MHKKHDTLGHIVKAARKNNDLTREQLAEKLGITPRYLMSIENENKKPSFDLLYRLIRVLDISSDSIFYPEKQYADPITEQLVHKLRLCDERGLKIIQATLNTIIETK